MFKPGFSSLTLLEAISQVRAYRTITFFGRLFQVVRHDTGSSAFARRYSRSRGCFPFLQLLRCFSSLRSLHTAYAFSRR